MHSKIGALLEFLPGTDCYYLHCLLTCNRNSRNRYFLYVLRLSVNRDASVLCYVDPFSVAGPSLLLAVSCNECFWFHTEYRNSTRMCD